MDIELIDANPAVRLRVKPSDPRLKPTRGPIERRSIPPQEIYAFINALAPRHRAVCWAPVLTGCCPGELFAMQATAIDPDAEMIYLHQTIRRNLRFAALLWRRAQHCHAGGRGFEPPSLPFLTGPRGPALPNGWHARRRAMGPDPVQPERRFDGVT